MFEINGNTYSLEDLQQESAKYNMSFEDYLSAMKDKGLKQVVDQDNVNWFDQTWLGRGISAASTTGEASDLFLEGSNVDIETVQDFMKAREQQAKSYVPSADMQAFQEQYKKEGSSWTAFFRGVSRNPKLMAELFVQSLGTQIGTAIDSGEARTAAATAGAVGVGAGAATFTPFGMAVGGFAGAMGGLAASMETALTFGELIEEELKKEGKEFTDENIKALLEGPKGRTIRNRSIGRGISIGAIETLSGGLASKATTAAARAVATTGRVGRTAKVSGVAAGTAVEAVGGGTGEVVGR